ASFGFTGTVSGSGIDHFECDLDGGGFPACASIVTYTVPTVRSRTLQVRAVDKAGNTDPSPASFSWLVDTTPPGTSITSHPSDPKIGSASCRDIACTAAGAGIDHYEYEQDGGGVSTVASGATYTDLTGESH